VTECLVADAAAVERAAGVLRAGGLVAFPTETVYGLGASALDEAAVAAVFRAKGRPAHDPLIVHVLDLAGAEAVAAAVPPLARRLAEAFWPGPLTLVLPKAEAVPPAVTAGLDSVAVRSPAHPVARALLAAVDLPIAAPSANRFGHVSPTTAQHVLDDLDGRIDLVLDGGACPLGLESTVVDARGPEPLILRPGAITAASIGAVAGPVPSRPADPSGAPSPSPGQLGRHYAPATPLVLLTGEPTAVTAALAELAARLAARGRTVGLLAAADDLPVLPTGPRIVLRAPAALADTEAAAARLYADLRALEAAGTDWILARSWGTTGLGPVLDDRLRRAAEGHAFAVDAEGPETAWRWLEAADRRRFAAPDDPATEGR
jgi:L-threonylcarbamoyladenylate synthase